MSEFLNLTVVKKRQSSFYGEVASRNIIFADGSFKTLGIMLSGEYEFGINEAKRIKKVQGIVKILCF